jgi:hypothetical protein
MLAGGNTFTHAVYQMRRMNLEAYLAPKNGFIIDPCFQEVDVVTGRPVFRWYSFRRHLYSSQADIFQVRP